ncbi:WD40-repeat-containing domain protein [Gautieria morchelliformis]|nr:WD40-repeat-containing domain protein [Gautieria morchelliformis]
MKEFCEDKYSLSVQRAAGDLIRKITLIETPERPDGSSSSVERTLTQWEVLLAPLLLPSGGLFLEEVSESDGHTDWITSVVFSHDSKCIVTGSFDKTICMWNADTRELISAPFEGHTASVRSVVFSDGGKCIVSRSDDGMIHVWNADTGEVISAPFEGHTHIVTSVTFLQDGTT